MNANGGQNGTQSSAEYLEVTSLAEGIFLIGVLDTGVTIFNQQVRALNLIWALDDAGRLQGASSIAVVGGGIAGLTAAMALRHVLLRADSGHSKVTLFEQRSVLCPLQRGCATRWVHPHVYDWPDAGSTNPSAALPIMNWRAGRASDVAATIVSEWEDEPHNGAVKVEEWRNLRYLKIHDQSLEVEWVGEEYVRGTHSTQMRGEKQAFDIIILAIGFGTEHRIAKHRTISYWRNETYGQPDLSGRQQRYLVSGTGDGGLVDLLRLRITDFREDRIGHQIAAEGSEPYKAIQNLRQAAYNDPSAQGSELFDRARQLGQDHHLIDAMRLRLRADTVASLQLKRGHRISDAFRGKSSFLNRFLVSLLFETGGFSPRFGNLETVGAEDLENFDHVIVRHGTNTEDHIQSVFSENVSSLLTALKAKRSANPIVNVSERNGLWEPGWPFNRKAGSGLGSMKRDYVPDATVAVSSAFVSALAPVFLAHGGHYRATLHRVVAMHHATEVHLQQIAHYHGPRAASKGTNVTGRLFKITDAVIGLAARSRRVLTTRAPTGISPEKCRGLLRQDMEKLGGDNWDPRRMDDEVSALLACPLVFLSDGNADPIAVGKVIAVLFADSTQVGAFDEETVKQLVDACREFGRYLSRIARNEAKELISPQSQATFFCADGDGKDLFDEFSILTASETPPPCVEVDYVNLEWWT